MNRLVFSLFFLAIGLFAVSVSAEEINHYFAAPKEWKAMSGADNGMFSFQTASEKKDSLLIVVRPIRAVGQNPKQWASDEIAAIEKQGFKLLEGPAESVIGQTTFTRLVSWNDLAGFGLRNEQYFCAYPKKNSVVEAAILGPEPFFESERGRIEEFLKTFHFE